MWWRYLYNFFEKKNYNNEIMARIQITNNIHTKAGFLVEIYFDINFYTNCFKTQKFKNIFNLFFYLQPNRKQSKTQKFIPFQTIFSFFCFHFCLFSSFNFIFYMPYIYLLEAAKFFPGKIILNHLDLIEIKKSVAQIKTLNNKRKKIQII